ncbi:MAG: hypothetical protein LBK41_07680 [Clostridiales bacterium]|jgi:hypothetical protein|nr:hypothetical protein [Clostridiales bacterium]
MICRKCKTASRGDTRECPYCGAALNAGAALWALGIVTVVSIVLVSGLFFLFRPPFAEDKAAPELSVVSASANPTGTPPASGEPDGVPGEPAEPDVYDKLSAVFKELSERSTFANCLSKNGFLFDAALGVYITPDDVSVYALYLPLTALAGYREAGLAAPPRGLKLIVVAESGEYGHMAYLSGDIRGILYRESLNALLASFSWDHGQITRPADASAIISAIADYGYLAPDPSGYAPLYVARDDKYVLAAISGPDGAIESFVLEITDDGYALSADGFDVNAGAAMTINGLLPDFNAAMIPSAAVTPAPGVTEEATYAE